MTLNYLQPSADLRCQTNFKLVYAQGCVNLETRKGGGAFSLVTASHVKEGQPWSSWAWRQHTLLLQSVLSAIINANNSKQYL